MVTNWRDAGFAFLAGVCVAGVCVCREGGRGRGRQWGARCQMCLV